VSAGSEDDSGFFSGLYSRLISWLYDGVYLGYVPEHRFVSLKKPVTIHDLLTHTAGIATGGLGQAIAPWNSKLSSGKDKNAGTNAKDFLENITIKSFTEMLSEGPLDFQPGSRHQYSGFGGMDVVARLIEITSNQPFNEFVQNNIFEPLDMHDTHWRVPDDKLGKIVEIAGGSKGGSKYQGSDTKFSVALSVW
jgi:CubicO group peptidase (beta-lactamase class C family)